eukprot:1558278-Amphidinium_carterae.1
MVASSRDCWQPLKFGTCICVLLRSTKKVASLTLAVSKTDPPARGCCGEITKRPDSQDATLPYVRGSRLGPGAWQSEVRGAFLEILWRFPASRGVDSALVNNVKALDRWGSAVVDRRMLPRMLRPWWQRVCPSRWMFMRLLGLGGRGVPQSEVGTLRSGMDDIKP